jgi:hypothetical protein
MHPAEHISMAAIFRACKANRLQWYLGPPPGDKEEKQRVIGEVVVPDLPLDKLKGKLGSSGCCCASHDLSGQPYQCMRCACSRQALFVCKVGCNATTAE